MANRPHVVVIGAGFAGIECARRLVHEAVEVTLVDRHNYSTFTPLLYQVATAGLTGTDVAYPIRGLFHDAPNVHIRAAEVTGVDWDRSVVTLDEGELPFDHLVLAAGATTNWFGIEGAAEHSLPLATLEDAQSLKAKLEEAPVRLTVKAGREGRLFGSVKTGDIADAVQFLASPMARVITGVALPVDAGLTAGNRLMADELTLDPL